MFTIQHATRVLLTHFIPVNNTEIILIQVVLITNYNIFSV